MACNHEYIRLKFYMDKGKDDRVGNLQWYTIHSELLNRFKDLCTLGDSQVKDLMITRKKLAASCQQKYYNAQIYIIVHT